MNIMKHNWPLIHNYVPTNICDGIIGSVFAGFVFAFVIYFYLKVYRDFRQDESGFLHLHVCPVSLKALIGEVI